MSRAVDDTGYVHGRAPRCRPRRYRLNPSPLGLSGRMGGSSTGWRTAKAAAVDGGQQGPRRPEGVSDSPSGLLRTSTAVRLTLRSAYARA